MLMTEALKWVEWVWENMSWESLRLDMSRVWVSIFRSEEWERSDAFLIEITYKHYYK